MENTAITIATQSKTQESKYKKQDYKATNNLAKGNYNYPEKIKITWYNNSDDPNVVKPKDCHSKFYFIDNKWCNYDKIVRIWGDRPPGGRGRKKYSRK